MNNFHMQFDGWRLVPTGSDREIEPTMVYWLMMLLLELVFLNNKSPQILGLKIIKKLLSEF
jgi:hypothetical protein